MFKKTSFFVLCFCFLFFLIIFYIFFGLSILGLVRNVNLFFSRLLTQILILSADVSGFFPLCWAVSMAG